MGNIHSERIDALRSLMAANGWDFVIISGSDPHSSEYPALRWRQVTWLSGFTGEAGDMVVTRDYAGLWTDSRYFIQAERQLSGSGTVLNRTRVPDAVTIPQWIGAEADRLGSDNCVVAIDGSCCSIGFAEELSRYFGSGAVHSVIRIVDIPDMLSAIWEDRPPVPSTPVITLSEENVGESRYDKLTRLRKFLMMDDCDAIFLSALDEIAWLLNVRGSDIEYNPYVLSYLLVTQNDAVWYVGKPGQEDDPDTGDSFVELEADGVQIRPYSGMSEELERLLLAEDLTIRFDPSTLNNTLGNIIRASVPGQSLKTGKSPIVLWKAVKNAVEIESVREAFLEDGIAMEKFIFWLESTLSSYESVSEREASDRLTAFRAEIPGYRGDSFANISAYGQNAALPHYETPEFGSARLEKKGLYLVDSGGQYLFGTTDITRTIPLGDCTFLEKEDYTLALKGLIALSSAVFPRGTAGCHLDILARNALWRSYRNFGHGTGHGLGFYLGVHEGPQDIRQNFNDQPLLPGMITSNEPSVYRQGMHGVRHENILLCREECSNEFASWLSFETLTLCHIDTSAIIRELMTADEIKWLNRYNRTVFERLSPRLDAEIASWLEFKTRPVEA